MTLTWDHRRKTNSFQPTTERKNLKMKLRRFILTLKGEEDEESEIVGFLRRL